MKPPKNKRVRKPRYLKVLYQAACDWHWHSTKNDDHSPEMKKLFRALRAFEKAEQKARRK